MKFKGSGSKGTRVIERKRSVTDGHGKNNMSSPEGGDIIIGKILLQHFMPLPIWQAYIVDLPLSVGLCIRGPKFVSRVNQKMEEVPRTMQLH